jgi:tRNA A37 threonylcarbamoyladenosine dehydratase
MENLGFYQIDANEFLSPRSMPDFLQNVQFKVSDFRQVIQKELIKNGKSDIIDRNLEVFIGSDASVNGHKFSSQNDVFYYGWKKELIIIPNKEIFYAIRFLRNLYKINFQEQKELLNKRIGVVGLSVGMSVFKTLILEGIGGKFRIADFDILELSNLNRIDFGLFDLHRSKTEMAYRFAKESNPYVEIEVYNKGVQYENADQFFKSGQEKLDLIIDECDSIAIKILIRKLACEYRIPVIMHTSDRGIIDVERFDTDDKDKSHPYSFIKYSHLTENEINKNALSIIMDICEYNNAKERTKFSLSEIGKTITSWPQLAHEVVAGGASVGSASLNLFLNQLKTGRYYVDNDKILQS